MTARPPSTPPPPGGPPHGQQPGQPPGPPPWDTVSMGPPPRRTRWRLSRPLVITGVVALVVGAGAGAALAVTGSSQSPATSSAVAASPSPTPSTPGRPHFRFGPGGFGALGGPLGALHGQFVAPKPGGGFQTLDVQRGQVTSVSTSAITLKSDDGFTKTYEITSGTNLNALRDGITSVKTGDQAFVVATDSNGTATAVSVADLSALKGLRQHVFGSGQALPANPG